MVKSVNKFIAIDCETFPIRSGLLVPRLVCGSISDGTTKRLLKREDWLKSLWELINSDVNICGHHICFDLAIAVNQDPRLLVPVFKIYEQGRVYDTMVNGKLIDIAEGNHDFCDYKAPDGTVRRLKTKHSLQQYVLRWFHNDLAKGKDTWRLRYGELDGLDIENYPSEAIRYAEDDALWTHKVNAKQLEYAGVEIPTRILQTQASFVLHLMGVYGLRTNRNRVGVVRNKMLEEFQLLERKLFESGYLKPKGGKYARDLKKIRNAVIEAYDAQGLPVPVTDKDNVSTDAEVLESSNNEDLKNIAKYVSLQHDIGIFLPLLIAASEIPFNPSWNVLVNSGRTSCGSDEAVGNLQNFPRGGDTRSCFEPRKGNYYCSVDYDVAELRSLAEVSFLLFGHSVLGDELNEGKDPHLALGADLINISYDEAVARRKDKDVKEARQFAKIPNFGAPGGLQPPSLVSYAKGYGIELTLERAKELYSKWINHYTEMREFFAYNKSQARFGQTTTHKHPITEFVRGDIGYTQLCNQWFQNLTAIGAKLALWNVSRTCYTDNKASLFGSRPVLFLHDEIVTEIPKERAHEAAYQQTEIMKDSMNVYTKRVPASASPALMDRWYKGAETVLKDERLVIWEPK